MCRKVPRPLVSVILIDCGQTRANIYCSISQLSCTCHHIPGTFPMSTWFHIHPVWPSTWWLYNNLIWNRSYPRKYPWQLEPPLKSDVVTPFFGTDPEQFSTPARSVCFLIVGVMDLLKVTCSPDFWLFHSICWRENVHRKPWFAPSQIRLSGFNLQKSIDWPKIL